MVGLHLYRGRLAERDAWCVRPHELRFARAASWMTPEIDREIRSQFNHLPERLSVLDDSSAPRLADCLQRSPWIRQVHYVRLDQPRGGGRSGGVEISMTFRRPVAFVEHGCGDAARYVLVDGRGHRLGKRAYEEPYLGDRLMMVVTGVRGGAPEAGQAWNDPAVEAAADIAAFLRPYATRYKLSRIDVSDRGGPESEPQVVLYTRRGRTRIIWGGPRCRRSEILEECTAEEKLSRLDTLYERYGALDGIADELDLVERLYRRGRPAPQRRAARPPLRS